MQGAPHSSPRAPLQAVAAAPEKKTTGLLDGRTEAAGGRRQPRNVRIRTREPGPLTRVRWLIVIALVLLVSGGLLLALRGRENSPTSVRANEPKHDAVR